MRPPAFPFCPRRHIRCGARLYRLFSRPTSLLLLVLSPAEYCTVLCALLGDIDDRWSSVDRGGIGYRPIGRGLGARGSRIEGRRATKGDEWWERCSAGVYTLVWGRLVGWWLGPEGAEVE
jgi:hypothetical protein